MYRASITRQLQTEPNSASTARPQPRLSDLAPGSAFELRGASESRLLSTSSALPSAIAPLLPHSLRTLMRSPLIVNEPGDRFEQEADRVADQVMRLPDPVRVQRKCAACEAKEEKTTV